MQVLKKNMLSMLNENRMKNAFLIKTLENEPDTEAYIYNGSAAVYENRAENWLFSLENTGDFTELYKIIDRPLGTFYVNTTDFADEIRAAASVSHIQQYIQYNIEPEMFISDPGAVNPDIKIVPIDKSWTDFILTLYKGGEFGNKKYIEACIETNPGFGALYNGKKIGYVLIHMDGEIGSMVISEKFRGKGAGRTLMQYITPLYAAQASIGCGFVLPGNKPSQRMMEKSCFVPLNKKIMWVYCRKSVKLERT